jgi:hypothetical protein
VFQQKQRLLPKGVVLLQEAVASAEKAVIRVTPLVETVGSVAMQVQEVMFQEEMVVTVEPVVTADLVVIQGPVTVAMAEKEEELN